MTKLKIIPTPEQISEARRIEYLKAWPVEKQMEALVEAQQGRPEKLEELSRDFSKIRAKHRKGS